MTFPVRIRPLEPGDLPFVLQTWIRTAQEEHYWWRQSKRRGGRPLGPEIPDLLLTDGLHSRVGRLLARSVGLAAGHADHPGQVLGYVVAEPEARALHMLYVKGGSFRRMGIGGQLLAYAGACATAAQVVKTGPRRCPLSYYTQHTAAMRHLAKRWGLTFNPFLLESPELPALEERVI